jgi:hypothetical protein
MKSSVKLVARLSYVNICGADQPYLILDINLTDESTYCLA